MAMQQFSKGDRVRWQDGESARTGVITESDVEEPADAGDKAGIRFYRVTTADGQSRVLPENELEPTQAEPDPDR